MRWRAVKYVFVDHGLLILAVAICIALAVWIVTKFDYIVTAVSGALN